MGLRAGPMTLAAQALPIPLGTRVRLEMHDKSRLEGILISQSADSLVVAPPTPVVTAVSTEYIARVRRSEGKSHAHGAVQGIKIGAVIGGGATALLFGGT